MYAVVEAGGKQHRVSPGDVMIVNRLTGESGDQIDLPNVLMLDDGKKLQVGSPFLAKTAIQAEILEQKRGKKIIVFKKKRRQGYRRKHGHRQHLTVLRVLDFAGSGVAAKTQKATKPEKPSAAAEVKEAPVKQATPTKKPAEKTAAAKKEVKATAAKEAKPKKAAAPKKTTTAAAKPKKPSKVQDAKDKAAKDKAAKAKEE
ncbi:MAG: 50S ribosomal protein L21 [Pseudomonadota bacterium]